LTGDANEGQPAAKLFSLQKDLDALDRKLGELGDVVMLGIDPVTAYMDGIDSHKNSDVRGVLATLKMLAEKHNVAIVLISHVNKDGARALMSVSGSLAFVAAARALYLVVEDPQDQSKKRRLLLPINSNIGSPANGLAYIVESVDVAYAGGSMETSRIEWDQPNTVCITAQEAFAQSRSPSKAGDEIGPKGKAMMELIEVKGPLKPAEVAAELKWEVKNVYNVAKRLFDAKKLRKDAQGRYVLIAGAATR